MVDATTPLLAGCGRNEEPVRRPEGVPVSPFGKESTARTLLEELQDLLSAPVFISPVESGGTLLYRVRVGPVENKQHLLALQQRLQDSGYDAGQPLP